MGATTNTHREVPTKRAALAGIIIASLALVAVGTAALWERPASVPTYDGDQWTGTASPVADFAEVTATGIFSACPTATLSDGSTAGVLLVEGWSATIPGLSSGSRGDVPGLVGPEGLALPAGPVNDPIMGRVLDMSVAADAALASTWIDSCGPVDAVVLVEPGSTVRYLALVS